VIKFKCVYCGQRILAGNKGAGKKGKCPKCNRLLVIPDATKIGTAISPDKEPIPERTLPHSPESGKDPRLDSDEPTEYFTEIFKEKFGSYSHIRCDVTFLDGRNVDIVIYS